MLPAALGAPFLPQPLSTSVPSARKARSKAAEGQKAHTWGSKMSAGNVEPAHTRRSPRGRCPGAPSLLPQGTHKPFLLDRKALGEAQAASTQRKALGPAPPEASGPIAGSLPEASPHSDVVADASPSPGDTSPNSSPAKANLGNSRDKEIYPGLRTAGPWLGAGSPAQAQDAGGAGRRDSPGPPRGSPL